MAGQYFPPTASQWFPPMSKKRWKIPLDPRNLDDQDRKNSGCSVNVIIACRPPERYEDRMT